MPLKIPFILAATLLAGHAFADECREEDRVSRGFAITSTGDQFMAVESVGTFTVIRKGEKHTLPSKCDPQRAEQLRKTLEPELRKGVKID